MVRTYQIYKASDWGRSQPHEKAYPVGDDWYIDIADADLRKFHDEVGEIILRDDTIIIYDDYIE